MNIIITSINVYLAAWTFIIQIPDLRRVNPVFLHVIFVSLT